ncbi:MAG: glycosyl transferase family 2 [Frankiales bacterium]|nr:glycosyl transferase family 2 [Frankiales bacterium]
MGEPLDRGIEWTGERCVPWTPDVQVAYEHYHRYALARGLAEGKRVLDLACGEGYGSSLLAEVASEVVGVDIDAPSIDHAIANYGSDKLSFAVGSMTDPALLADVDRFDLVVCFEAIEHVGDHNAVLSLIKSRLNPGGVLIISTPDVEIYSHDHGNDNPFHVKELTGTELYELLARNFGYQVLFNQSMAMGSVIYPAKNLDAPGDVVTHTLDRVEDGWTIAPGLPHTYLVALASDEPLKSPPAAAIMLDPDFTLLQSQLTPVAQERDELRGWRDRLLNQHDVERAEIEMLRADQSRLLDQREIERGEVEELKSALRRVESLRVREQETAKAARAEADETRGELARLSTQLHLQTRAAEREAAMVEWLRESILVSSRQAAVAEQRAIELQAVTDEVSAPVQRALRTYRNTIERYAPRGTPLRRAYESAMGRGGASPQAALVQRPHLGPVTIMTSQAPLVSIVIPVHGKWSYTQQCLRSIAGAFISVPFEVIVVDDASPDNSAARIAECPGVRLVSTGTNLGFVGACNLGAASARAALIMFLNNDTEVLPDAVERLVETANSDDRIGLVGAKLIYPDGSLQEAGGIIWSDASGWNYGRNGDSNDPAVNVLRDVDYVSGAAILVRRDLFEQVGGFDRRYAPAYYEDADLAFAIRATGHRVIVQPRAVVVHHEGISNGTDSSSGIKRYQELNRKVFAEKWAAELTQQFSGPNPANLWLARQRDPLDQDGPLVLVLDHKVPMPDMDAGSARMSQVIRQLVGLGCRVVFFPANDAEPEPYTEELRQLGVTVLTSWGRQLEFIRELGSELRFTLLSRPNVAWRFLEELRRLAPKCVIAYDTVDVHFLRLERQAKLFMDEGDSETAYALQRTANTSRELELGLARTCDLTFVVSDVEQKLLSELVPDADVRVLSIIHEIDWVKADLSGRAGVLFVGSYDHPPNRDAANWLVNEIMPLVHQQVPDAVLHVVGSNPTKEIEDLARPGVRIHGFVSDLNAMYAQCRVATAPLRFGAGVKGKIGESISHGVPTVATTLATEGMHLVPGEDVLAADGAAEFAAHIVLLLTEDSMWRRISESAKATIADRFSPQAARAILADVLQLATQDRVGSAG